MPTETALDAVLQEKYPESKKDDSTYRSEKRPIDNIIIYEELSDLVEFLRDKGAHSLEVEINSHNDEKYYPLHYAYERSIEKQDYGILKHLLGPQCNANPNFIYPMIKNPIILDTRLYQYSKLNRDILDCFLTSPLLALKHVKKSEDGKKEIQTALHLATQANLYLYVEKIIEFINKHKITVSKSGINRRDGDGDGKTPIYYAVRHKNLEMAKLLSKNGGQLLNDSEAVTILIKQSSSDIKVKRFLFEVIVKSESAGYRPRLVSKSESLVLRKGSNFFEAAQPRKASGFNVDDVDTYGTRLANMIMPDPQSHDFRELQEELSVPWSIANDEFLQLLISESEWYTTLTQEAISYFLSKSDEERKAIMLEDTILFEHFVYNFFKHVMCKEDVDSFKKVVLQGNWLGSKTLGKLEQQILNVYYITPELDCICLEKTGFKKSVDFADRFTRLIQCSTNYCKHIYGSDSMIDSVIERCRRLTSDDNEDDNLSLKEFLDAPLSVFSTNRCPMESLLLWSIFSGRWKITEYLFLSTDYFSIPLNLVAIRLLEAMEKTSCVHRTTLTELKLVCEDRLLRFVNHCFKLEDRSYDFCMCTFLNTPLPTFGNLTCVDLAAHCSNTRILSETAFQEALSTRWKGILGHTNAISFMKHMLFGLIFPINLLFLKSVRCRYFQVCDSFNRKHSIANHSYSERSNDDLHVVTRKFQNLSSTKRLPSSLDIQASNPNDSIDQPDYEPIDNRADRNSSPTSLLEISDLSLLEAEVPINREVEPLIHANNNGVPLKECGPSLKAGQHNPEVTENDIDDLRSGIVDVDNTCTDQITPETDSRCFASTIQKYTEPLPPNPSSLKSSTSSLSGQQSHDGIELVFAEDGPTDRNKHEAPIYVDHDSEYMYFQSSLASELGASVGSLLSIAEVKVTRKNLFRNMFNNATDSIDAGELLFTADEKTRVVKGYRWDSLGDVYDFYQCPKLKVAFHAFSHIVFFVLASIVMAEEDRDVNLVEWIMYIVFFGFLLEEITEVFSHIAKKSFDSSYVKNKWNLIDWGSIIFFLLSYIFRLIESSLRTMATTDSAESDTVLADNLHSWMHLFRGMGLLLFGMRLLYLCLLSNHLGPRLYVTYLMFRRDLFPTLSILVIIILAFGVFIEGILNPTHKGWNFLLGLFQICFYAMFGEYNLDNMLPESSNSTESGYTWSGSVLQGVVVFIALPVYVIISQLLILNLIIALFAKTVDSHITESKGLWLKKRYQLTIESQEHSFFPSPFNIIEIFVRLIRLLTEMCNCKKITMDQPEERKRYIEIETKKKLIQFQFHHSLALRNERQESWSNCIRQFQ